MVESKTSGFVTLIKAIYTADKQNNLRLRIHKEYKLFWKFFMSHRIIISFYV